MSLPDWKCSVCGKDADYKYGKKTYCVKHWNYGQPVKPTLDNCLEATNPLWYKELQNGK